jgi:hypothetical protein
VLDAVLTPLPTCAAALYSRCRGRFCFSLLVAPSLFHPHLATLLCPAHRSAAPRQVMPLTSHQAKRRWSCRLVLGFASSERAPSSRCRVSKHQSTKPPSAFALHIDSSPPTMIRHPSTSVSSAPAPRCSLTQLLGASTTRSSHPRQFPIDRTAPPWRSFLGEPPSSPTPQSSQPHRARAPSRLPDLPCHRQAGAGRATASAAMATPWPSALLLLWAGPEAISGPEPSQAKLGRPVSAQRHSSLFLFPFSLIQIKVSNFRKL